MRPEKSPLEPKAKRWLLRAGAAVAAVVAALQSGYGVALLAVALATTTALGLGLGSEPGVFAPFLVAVVAVALRHGVAPALATIALATVAAYLWLLAPMMALAFDPGALRRLAFFRLGVFAIAGVVITLLIESKRQAWLELERSRRQLRAFATNEDVGLQVVDHDGRIIWADNGTARLLGYDTAEFMESPFARFHADPALAADVQARLAIGSPIENIRASLVRHDGHNVDVLLNSNSLLGDARADGSGVVLAVLPVVTTPAPIDAKLAVSVLLERRRKAAAEKRTSTAL